jgi:hypothetical protein
MWRVDYNRTNNTTAALATSGVTGMVVTVECGQFGHRIQAESKRILFMSYHHLVPFIRKL